MIQDRLTAKFLGAQSKAKRAVKAAPKAVEEKTAPVTDRYTAGRTISGTFWL